MLVPQVPTDDTDSQSTVRHAAKVFEGLLFAAPAEGQEPPPDSEATEVATPPADEPAPDAQEVEAEVTEPTTPPTEKRARKLKFSDGTEEEVTEDEAYNGYLRQKDYTHKTTDLAKLRKDAEAEAKSTREARTQYLERLEEIRKSMDTLIPREPDWAALRAKGVSDADIAAAAADYKAWKDRRDLVVAEQQRVAEEAAEDARTEFQKRVTEENEKLLEVLPEWRDQGKATAEQAELVAWLRGKGYNDEWIGSIADHRLVYSLRNAMLFEKAKSKPGTKKPSNAPRTVAPGGTPAPRRPVSDREARAGKLAETGKVADAAKLFETIPGL